MNITLTIIIRIFIRKSTCQGLSRGRSWLLTLWMLQNSADTVISDLQPGFVVHFLTPCVPGSLCYDLKSPNHIIKYCKNIKEGAIAPSLMLLSDKLLFIRLLSHQNRTCHCEPVRTLARQSPGSSDIFVENRDILPFNGGIATSRDLRCDCHWQSLWLKSAALCITLLAMTAWF